MLFCFIGVAAVIYEFNHHIDVIRTLAKERNWTKQKVKSIRGQVLSMGTFDEREAYLQKIIKSRK